MKLKGTTILLVLGAVILGGAVYLFEDVHQIQQEQQAEQKNQIFQFTDAELTGFTITVDDELLVFERDRDQDSTEQWTMKAPETGQANTATVEFLTDILIKGERKQTFLAKPDNLDTYGLREPFATISITLDGQSDPEILQLGSLNFDQTKLYAQTNPAAQTDTEQEILVVPIELKYAVERQPKTWLATDKKDKDSEK